MLDKNKPRLLVFIVAFNAQSTISSVLSRIPSALSEAYDVSVLAIDDASSDQTFIVGEQIRAAATLPFPLRVLVNPVNQGYGGNQKLGYHFAIDNNFDFVALIHGDGQYAPEALPELLEPLRTGAADAVFGSRMLTPGGARRGGMPLYKYVGNKILTWVENKLLRTRLSEFHSGYRIYSVNALRQIPFDRNTNDFHFDTEIIIQLTIARQRIQELPIPTYYGDEICHVNGLRYAKDVVWSVLKARAQEWSIFYDPKFDCAPALAINSHYELKLGYQSTHQTVLNTVKPHSRVLDLGCAGGMLCAMLKSEAACHVTGVDSSPLAPNVNLDAFIQHDLNAGLPSIDLTQFDYVLLLDVIEHLDNPERFVALLRAELCKQPTSTLLISTGNIGFVLVRIMLLLGQFNYGKKGILDLTHKRLFTFSSLSRLLEQGGFRVSGSHGISPPYPLVFGNGPLGRALVTINALFARFAKSLFSYQMFLIAKPTPMVSQLLDAAISETSRRTEIPSTILEPTGR